MKRLTGLTLILGALIATQGCKKPVERIGETYPVTDLYAFNCEGCSDATNDYVVSYLDKEKVNTFRFHYHTIAGGRGGLSIIEDPSVSSALIDIDSTQIVFDVCEATNWIKIMWAKLRIPKGMKIRRVNIPLPRGT